MRVRCKSSILIAVVVLALPGASFGQVQASRAVATTPHFAFFSDPTANLNDALIAAGRARRAKSQELFQSGPEKPCFDKLTPAERVGWARAVDYFAEIVAPFDINAREQILFRIELMAGSDWATGDDRSFMAIARSIRAAAMPAYERCRWPAQDASNRQWIDQALALLKVHEAALGERLPQVYGNQWARLPYRIDIVDSVSQLGGNAQFFVPVGPHILIASSGPANKDDAVLEAVFHEASHSLAGSMEESLRRSERARGGDARDLPHAVIFYLTGETVRRVFEQAGEPYTPLLHALKLWPENVRDALAKTLSPYLNGQGTMVQAIDSLAQALNPARP